MPGRAFGIAEQRAGGRQGLRTERFQHLARDLARQFIKQRHAVIGRHAVEHVAQLVAGERQDEFGLSIHRQAGEHGRGTVLREQPEHDAFVLGGQIDQDVRQVGVIEPMHDAAKTAPVARRDEFLDLDLEQMPEHAAAA